MKRLFAALVLTVGLWCPPVLGVFALAAGLWASPVDAQCVNCGSGGGSGGGGGGSGTVTSVSVVSANGLAGSVATSTTTPAITLSTTVTGVVCGNGTALSACAAGSGVPGGSTTQLQYNNAGSFGGITGATTNGTFVTLTTPVLGVASATSVAIGGATIGSNALAVTGTSAFDGGTVTASTPFITPIQTWNSGAVTFVGKSTDITSTASAALSRVERWRVGGAEVAGIVKDGSLFSSLGLYASAAASFNGANYYGMAFTSSAIDFYTPTFSATSAALSVGRNSGWGAQVANGLGFSLTSSTTAPDSVISRNAAGVLQFGTTAANASGAWLAAKGTLTGGTLGDQAQVLAITATQPASPTGTQIAISETITGAGSASQANFARSVTYAAGYTGSSFNAAGRYVNLNAGALSSGLLVSLAATFPSTRAALNVDNGAVATNIFIANDNGSPVFTIADGGAITTTSDITTGGNSTLAASSGSLTVSGAGGQALYLGVGSTFGRQVRVDAAGIKTFNTGVVGWSSDTTPFGTMDTTVSRNAAGVVQFGTTTNNAAGSIMAATIRTSTAYTVSTLPTGAQGMRAYVTDQLTACVATGAALVGGGAVVCPAFYNGSAWVGG